MIYGFIPGELRISHSNGPLEKGCYYPIFSTFPGWQQSTEKKGTGTQKAVDLNDSAKGDSAGVEDDGR